jgi:uncharacterized membrane protein YphA (DoxX/SURF4 family)
LFCTDSKSVGAVIIGLFAIVVGCLLLIGFLTPVSSALTAMGAAGSMASWLNGTTACILVPWPAIGFLIVIATSIILLGPGAYSLDSRLFGRREIHIPQASPSSEDT